MNIDNFTPYASAAIAATGTSSFTTFPVGGAPVGVRTIGNDILIQNVGTGLAYFRLGLTGATATTSDIALQPGSAMVFSLGGGDPNANNGIALPPTGIAVISAAGTTVNICMGRGS